jgi:molybdopterin/thiamine biosynthesis adenylyltransferase
MKTKTDLGQPRSVSLPSGAARRAGRPVLRPPAPLLGGAPDAFAALRRLAVVLVGVGSVGGRIAVMLARLGVGGLILVDPKRLKAESLATHEIGPADVGQPKAQVVGRRCKVINPEADVRVLVGPAQEMDFAVLSDAGVVVLSPDLLAAEVEVGQRCLWLGKSLIQASVHGATLTAQVRCFANAAATAPCPACMLGSQEWDLLARQVRFSCDGKGGGTPEETPAAPATNSLSPLCSVAADLAVLQLVRLVLKAGRPVADTLLEYNGFTHRTVISPLRRSPSCRLEHVRFAQVTLDEPLGSLSLAAVALRASGAPAPADGQFAIDGLDWVEFAGCGCAERTVVRQFVPRGIPGRLVCRKCARPLAPLAFYTHRTVTRSVLGAALEQPLRKLGAHHASHVLLRTGDSGVLIRAVSPSPTKP